VELVKKDSSAVDEVRLDETLLFMSLANKNWAPFGFDCDNITITFC
jgi:hypothetical protein